MARRSVRQSDAIWSALILSIMPSGCMPASTDAQNFSACSASTSIARSFRGTARVVMRRSRSSTVSHASAPVTYCCAYICHRYSGGTSERLLIEYLRVVLISPMINGAAPDATDCASTASSVTVQRPERYMMSGVIISMPRVRDCTSTSAGSRSLPTCIAADGSLIVGSVLLRYQRSACDMNADESMSAGASLPPSVQRPCSSRCLIFSQSYVPCVGFSMIIMCIFPSCDVCPHHA